MPTLSPAQKMRAQVRGWPSDLIERAQDSAASGRQIDNILNVSIEPERIAKWLDFIEVKPGSSIRQRAVHHVRGWRRDRTQADAVGRRHASQRR